MAFDPTTATFDEPGFDLSTATFDEGGSAATVATPEVAQEALFSPTTIAMFPALGQAENVKAVLGEFSAAANRSIADVADFFGPGAVNAFMNITGIDAQVPTLRGGMEGTSFEGGFMDPGTPRDIVQGAGGSIPVFAAGVTAVPRAIGTVGSAVLDVLGVGATKIAAPIATAGRATVEALTPGRSVAVREAKLPLLRESGDVAAAGFKLDEAGKVVTDQVQKAAIKQGFQEGFIAQVKTSSKKTRSKFKQMVDIAERGKKNFRFADTNRPSDISGGALDKRIRVVKSANRAAGRRMDSVVEALGTEVVDSSAASRNFLESIESMGVKFDPTKPFVPGKPGKLNIDFKGSELEFLTGPQSTLENVITRMLRPGANQAQEVHNIKRMIDNQVTFGKTESGLSGSAERVLKDLRSDLDAALDGQFPEYDRVNTIYAETIQALDAIQDVAGRKMDFRGKNIDKALGTMNRGLLSNRVTRVPLLDAIEELDRLANKYVNSTSRDIVPFRKIADSVGVTAKDLGDDLVGLTSFADELEQMFGPSARSGLASEVGKGVRQAARGAKEQAVDVGVAAVEKARGINEKNAFKAIKDLLKAT